jgi:Type IV secretory pathway, TrbL components
MHISKVQDVNVQAEKAEEYKAPTEETAWSRIKKALGPVAVVGVVIAKFLAKVKFILPVLLKSGGTMLLMVWVYMQLWGWQFALGFVLLLLVHETGHLIVAKKFGLKVGAPVFIPFMGAFIALKEAPATRGWKRA